MPGTALSAIVVCIILHTANGDIISDLKAYIIDLTHTFDGNVVFWAEKAKFNLTMDYRGIFRDYWYEANSYSAPEHGGTHIDAPAHFAKDKERLDQVKLDRLIGQAIVLDIVNKATKNRDYQVSVNDLLIWEKNHGLIPDHSIVLINTGWSHKWPNGNEIYGTLSINNTADYHFPGMHPDLAEWIVEHRPQIVGVGIDTPSIDYGQTTNFLSHQRLMYASICVFENVANLHLVPPSNATVFAIPMKIGDGSGGPLRIFAVVPTKPSITRDDVSPTYTHYLTGFALFACAMCIGFFAVM